MSSINPHYTFNYSQPAEYHFSHDSVFLSRRVFELLGDQVKAKRVLDLCAGCGIVGLDFLYHCREAGVSPASCDFLEVQQEYAPHFAENLQRFGPCALAPRFIVGNYASFEPADRYDLVICNPPFFRADQGRLSKSPFRNRCRFFIDSDFSTLMQALERILAPNGQAFLLLRDLGDHSQLEVIGDIRGTHLVRVLPGHKPAIDLLSGSNVDARNGE